MLGKLISSAAIATCLALPVLAESTTQPVAFTAGATGTAVTGQIVGADTADFTLTANAGQRMTVRMNADNPAAQFEIYAPGATLGQSPALFSSSSAGMSADLVLPASGTYVIRSALAQAAQAGGTARFSLTIDVAGRQAQSDDVANSLNAAPDFWQVTGITGQLNIRAEASTGAAVAGTAPNGAVLRNLGCQPADGRNWCKVETTSGSPVMGWAASDFLAPTTAPATEAAAQPGPQSAMPAASTAAMTATQPAMTAATAVTQQPAVPATAPQPAPSAPAGIVAPQASPVAAVGSNAPQPAPAAPAGTVAPVDRSSAMSARPPAAPASKVPLGGVTRTEAAPMAAPAISATKPAPKPSHAATSPAAVDTASGTLPCSTALGMPTRDCAYSLARSGGTTLLRVSWPDGGHREIRFENGAPAPVDGQISERRGSLTVIDIGSERYEVLDSIVNGG